MAQKRKPSRDTAGPSRTKIKGTGPGGGSKTRPDVPANPANRAASGKQPVKRGR